MISSILFDTSVHGQSLSLVCDGVCDVDWSPTNANLLASVNELGLWIYYLDTPENAPVLFPVMNIDSLDFSPDGNSIIVTACEYSETAINNCNGIVSIFDLKTETWQEIARYDYPITDIQFSPDGNSVAFLQKSQEQGLRIINLSTNDDVEIVEDALTILISAFAFSPDSSQIAISNGDLSWQNRVSIWDISNTQIITSMEVDGLIEDIIFSSDTSVNFVKSDATISSWDFTIDTTYLINNMIQINDNLHEYNFIEQSHYLLGSLTDNGEPRNRTLYVWNWQTGDEIFSTDTPPDTWHNILEMNMSGDYVLASDSENEDKIVDIWGIETGEHQQIIFSD